MIQCKWIIAACATFALNTYAVVIDAVESVVSEQRKGF